MNRNLAFAVVGILVTIGLVGAILLHLFRPDQTAAYLPSVITILGLVTTATGSLYGLGKVQEKVEKVERQTNGTLSDLRQRLREKDREIQMLNDRNVDLAKLVPPTTEPVPLLAPRTRHEAREQRRE